MDGHILRRNYLPKHIIKGKTEEEIEVTVIRGRRHKQLLDDLMTMKGYWKLKDEALDRAVWRTGSGTGYEPVVRETAD